MINRSVTAIAFVCTLAGGADVSLASGHDIHLGGCGHLAAYAPRLMQEFGWSRTQAMGALANFAHESHGRAIEQIGMRPGSGGFGWAQWTGVRRNAFMAFARANRLVPGSDAANYAFLAHELRTNFAHVARRMRGTRSVYEATTVFARDYEGAFSPGAIPAMASRHRWAQTLSAQTYVASAR